MSAGHDRSRTQPPADDDEEDLVDKLMRQTGCMEQHYAVQACMAEHNDWRRCQQRVTEFRQCMEEHHRRKAAGRGGDGGSS